MNTQLELERAYIKVLKGETRHKRRIVEDASDDVYTTHGGLEVKPYYDPSGWGEHNSFRNRPLVITKDTPDHWADDTEMAANLTGDAILAGVPVTGGPVVGVAGKLLPKLVTAAKPALTTAVNVAKPVLTTAGKAALGATKAAGKVAGKAALGVAKGGAKTAGKAAVLGGGTYLGAKKLYNDAKEELGELKDKVVDELGKFKDAPGEYMSDVGSKLLANAKHYGKSALELAKAHPYATAAVAVPLLVYGGKKAYDYLKSKFGDSSDEEGEEETDESCGSGRAVLDESVFDGMIEDMERHGFIFDDAGNDAIFFQKDGKRYWFNSWDEVEDCIADLDAGYANVFEDVTPPQTTAQQPQRPQQPAQQPQQNVAQTAQTAQQIAQQAQQTAQQAQTQAQQAQQTAQQVQTQSQQLAQQQQQQQQQASAASAPKAAVSESRRRGWKKPCAKNCTTFKRWKAKRQF